MIRRKTKNAEKQKKVFSFSEKSNVQANRFVQNLSKMSREEQKVFLKKLNDILSKHMDEIKKDQEFLTRLGIEEKKQYVSKGKQEKLTKNWNEKNKFLFEVVKHISELPEKKAIAVLEQINKFLEK